MWFILPEDLCISLDNLSDNISSRSSKLEKFQSISIRYVKPIKVLETTSFKMIMPSLYKKLSFSLKKKKKSRSLLEDVCSGPHETNTIEKH